MEEIIGTTWPVFIGLTLVLFGGAGFMMGQALANTWKPWWYNVAYGFMLSAGDHLASNFLFAARLGDFGVYIVHTVVLIAVALLAYRLKQARKMVQQYPWLYEAKGLFGWREKSA